MRAHLAFGGLLLAAIAPFGCDGQPVQSMLNEPFRVQGGQFISGELPGVPPSDGGAPAPGAIAVTNISTNNATVLVGANGSKTFEGRATPNAVSVGMRVDGLGSGYWVVPLRNPDPSYDNELSWSASCDFGIAIPTGRHVFRAVAFDPNGVAGQQLDFPICVQSRIPDNLHSCDPTIAPPDAVLTLTWDTDADLDLHVISPDGRDVTPKDPLTVPFDGGRPPDGMARINRDSIKACKPDGMRQEDLVFATRPSGTWTIYANLFDACTKPAVSFTLTVYEAEGDMPNRELVKTFERSGRLLDIDANGGQAPGLFVVDYPFD
jgi:hypothetical protein